jgi:hypothetical protein
MFDTKLRAPREYLAEFVEGVCAKVRPALIVAGKWVRPLYSPVHVVVHMLKEGSAVAALKSLEDFANTSSV